MLGINVINIMVKKMIKSFLRFLLGYFFLKISSVFAFIKIKINLANSLGWKDPIPGRMNQHFEPFTSFPKNNSNSNKALIKTYNIGDKSNIFLQFSLDIIKIIKKPIKYQIICFDNVWLFEVETA